MLLDFGEDWEDWGGNEDWFCLLTFGTLREMGASVMASLLGYIRMGQGFRLCTPVTA